MRSWVRNLLIVVLLVVPILVVSLSYLEDLAGTSATGTAEGLMSFVADVPRRVTALAFQAGYPGIFVLMLLEAAALPVPSELILPFAGYMVYRGYLSFWLVVFWSTLAALIGSFIDYYLGMRVGEAFFSGKSKLPFIDVTHLQRVGLWFNQYGTVAVTLLRLVPAARVLISFPAGVYRMGKLKFALCTLAGCLPWNVILVYLGWYFGSLWSTVLEAFRYVNIVAYALLILLVVWIVRKTTQRASANDREDSLSSQSSSQILSQDLKSISFYDVVDSVSRCQIFHDTSNAFLFPGYVRVFGDDVQDSIPDHLS
jgi:membrane protein DedA with SNARE-associated domain